MSSFIITHKNKPRTSRFAVGTNTGSLFIMTSINPGRQYWQGVILVGRGPLQGKDGTIHSAVADFFNLLPVGTVIEIET